MRGTTPDNGPGADGLCQCGCGQPAPIAKRTVRSRGRFKDQPMKFIRGHNSVGMDRSKPYKTHYVEEDRGYATPCWVWQLQTVAPNKRSSGGYGKMGIKGRSVLAHRFYFERAKGPIPEGLQLDHLCQVPACVNPEHLEPVTPLENMRRSRSMKLTPDEAQEIERLARAAALTIEAIAERFGVSRATVSLIKKNGADGPRRG